MTFWNSFFTFFTTLEFSAVLSFALRLGRYLTFIVIVIIGVLYSFGVQARLRTFSLFGSGAPMSAAVATTPNIAASGIVQEGTGSWYGGKFHGRRTASGETYDMNDFTAAHLTLPLGTVVRVTNTANGKSTLVRINDRGPYIEGRIIDLSFSAAKALNIVEPGTGEVKIEVVEGIRLTDSLLTSDFANEGYELAALRDASSSTAFSPANIQPLIVEQGTFSVLYNSDEFAEALKAWKKLRKKYSDVYLIPQRKTDEQLALTRVITQRMRRRGAEHTAPRLYTYQILRVERRSPALLAHS